MISITNLVSGTMSLDVLHCTGAEEGRAPRLFIRSRFQVAMLVLDNILVNCILTYGTLKDAWNGVKLVFIVDVAVCVLMSTVYLRMHTS